MEGQMDGQTEPNRDQTEGHMNHDVTMTSPIQRRGFIGEAPLWPHEGGALLVKPHLADWDSAVTQPQLRCI